MIFSKKIPWENRESIFEYIKDNINNRGRLNNADLPDDELDKNNNGVKWASGAKDGVMAHHSTANGADKELAKLIKKISETGKLKDKIAFYNLIIEDGVISLIDSTIEEIVELDTRVTDYLYEWCCFLAFESPDRGAVKFGIALLGVIDARGYLEDIKTLGLHEEFTLFVSVAINRLSNCPEQDLWDLAKKVDGWGRISIVERLANTTDPKIKYWILTEGYKNSILYEYLALIAAETGELKQALLNEEVDEKILDSASDLINSLMDEGPCEGISAYKDAAETIELFIKHTVGKREKLSYLITYGNIYDYVSDKSIDFSELEDNGWTDEKRNEIICILRKEIDNEQWKEKVLNDAKSTDNKNFWITKQAALLLKINLDQVYWDRLKDNPYSSSNWFDIMDIANEENIHQILEFGLLNVPLSVIGTGPDTLLGLGVEFKYNHILDFILQKLDCFEGEGIPYIITGLKSPVTRNRNLAISVLFSWDNIYITEKLRYAVEELEKIEPDRELKQRIDSLLDKFKSNNESSSIRSEAY